MSDYPDLQLYVGGTWRRTVETLPVVNPADERVIGAVPVASTDDLDAALEAAERGFAVWRRTSP
ncbi:aldehyde dehydrogenase family protein, partial [Rhizobiaceae sp. 2RAB30]